MEYKDLWAYLDMLDYEEYPDMPQYRTRYYRSLGFVIKVQKTPNVYWISKYDLPLLRQPKDLEIIEKLLPVEETINKFKKYLRQFTVC